MVGVLYFRAYSFPQRPTAQCGSQGVTSGISTHLEFSVVLIEAVLLLGFAIPLWAKRVNQFPTGQ